MKYLVENTFYVLNSIKCSGSGGITIAGIAEVMMVRSLNVNSIRERVGDLIELGMVARVMRGYDPPKYVITEDGLNQIEWEEAEEEWRP